MRKIVPRKILVFFLLSGFCLLLGCKADSLNGVYTGAGDTQEFRFSPDGTVVQSLMGKEVAEYKYKKNGDEIKIYLNAGTAQTWTVNKDGDLSFQMPNGGGSVTLSPKK